MGGFEEYRVSPILVGVRASPRLPDAARRAVLRRGDPRVSDPSLSQKQLADEVNGEGLGKNGTGCEGEGLGVGYGGWRRWKTGPDSSFCTA